MRERAVTTAIIWMALAFSILVIVGSVHYTAMVADPTNSTRLIEQTVMAPNGWLAGAWILSFLLIMAAMGGTLAIWTTVSEKSEQQKAEKAKRSERDARIKRLLTTLDDEDLDALEDARLGDDGERVSLEALMRKRS